jgi:ADP-ribosylglycohydrolase
MSDYRDRVMGCWLGKAIGGTLGQSFEGLDGPLDATFYEPVPTEMVPNDDLDLQVVWAVVLSALDRPTVDTQTLADAWLRHVEFPFNEYGVAKRNLREGVGPPLSGSYDNWFTCGEGAAIRSEVWACLAPGEPERAADFAAADACVDHAGDGVEAARFLAGMESAAFTGSSVGEAIEAGLSVIDADSGIHRVVVATRAWVEQGLSSRGVRERILDEFGVGDFTDVRQNTGFVVLGLLAGQGDFERSILITNNCGKDTDSSTASVGAMLGIWAPERIPARWLAPIGRDLVLSPGIVGLDAPGTLDEFTDLVMGLRERLGSTAATVDPREEPPLPIDAQACFYTMTDEHKNINTWFLPSPGSELADWPAPPAPFPVAGTWARLTAEEFDDDLLRIAYPIGLDQARMARVMVDANVPARVWLDGRWLFGRDGGPMFPTPHMPRINTFADLSMSAGAHELTIVLRRPAPGQTAEWVVAVADTATKEWIPHTLRRQNRP